MIDTNHYFFIEEVLKKGKVLYEKDAKEALSILIHARNFIKRKIK